MSGYIPYRRRPPPVRNMHSVLKKASWCTRRVFRSPPCSKQASGVQKGYSVPETPFSGTEQAMCAGKGLLVYRLKRRKAAQAPRSVILRKTAICMLLLLPLNSCRQLWAATKPLQIAADCRGLPQATANYAKLSQATRKAAPLIRVNRTPERSIFRRLPEKQRPQSAVNLHPGNETGREQQPQSTVNQQLRCCVRKRVATPGQLRFSRTRSLGSACG